MNTHAAFHPKYAQCRRNARVCALLAKDAATAFDRGTLLAMQQSWLALAENEEWLAGRRAAPARPKRGESQMAFWGS